MIVWEFWGHDTTHNNSQLYDIESVAMIQALKCTGLFYMHNSNNRDANLLVRALNFHSTL